ncbi:MAG: SpoIIE family protein phosphatase [Phycisphaerae bacterium]|nr:SpoIIE family protein phosphatase [Phycisphaerae bacterium]
MLRELIDTALLEDFASGLSRTSGLRVSMYDSYGNLIVAAPANNEFARLTGWTLGALPADMVLTPVPAHDPPGHVAFVNRQGVWHVIAPVYVDDRQAGYVGVGEFREHSLSGEHRHQAQAAAAADLTAVLRAWESLPELDRGGHSQAVVTARWGARLLAEWGRRESHLLTAAEQVALVGDVAELLTGEQDLQRVLDRIVADTARVMQCPFASLRLYDPKTNELKIKAVHNLSPEYVGKGAIVRTAGAVSDEALRGQIVYVEDVTTDPRVKYPAQARRQGIVSMLTAGMIYRGNPVGVIRVYTDRRRRFRKAQRDLLRAVAYQAATAVVHAQLVEERLHNADIERQLALAGDLQARMVRTPPPRHPRLEMALAFHPTYEVAGDFGDFLTLADGRLAAVVGDVVGKGIPASLLMSATRGALRAGAEHCRGPGDLLTRLNRQFFRETLPSEFITLLLIAIDAEARQLTYANAGHEPLLLLRDGQVRATTEAGLVLGIDPDEVYHEHKLDLCPDDLLLLYTDGAFEARNFADEVFGRQRLWESLIAYGMLKPEQVLKNIVWDIRRFVGLAEQSDDLTLVALRVRGEPGNHWM